MAGARGGAARGVERWPAFRAVAVVGERVAGADGRRQVVLRTDRVSRTAEDGGVRVHQAAAGDLRQAGHQHPRGGDAPRTGACLRPDSVLEQRDRGRFRRIMKRPHTPWWSGQAPLAEWFAEAYAWCARLRADRARSNDVRDLRLRPDADPAPQTCALIKRRRARPHAAGAAARRPAGRDRRPRGDHDAPPAATPRRRRPRRPRRPGPLRPGAARRPSRRRPRRHEDTDRHAQRRGDGHADADADRHGDARRQTPTASPTATPTATPTDTPTPTPTATPTADRDRHAHDDSPRRPGARPRPRRPRQRPRPPATRPTPSEPEPTPRAHGDPGARADTRPDR